MALSICVAASANWPEYGMIRPILTGCCASAKDVAKKASAARIAAKCRVMGVLLLRTYHIRPCRAPQGWDASHPLFNLRRTASSARAGGSPMRSRRRATGARRRLSETCVLRRGVLDDDRVLLEEQALRHQVSCRRAHPRSVFVDS